MSTDVLTQAIDPAGDRAVYKQIADHLRAAIAQGRLREGDQLPSEAQLMTHYGVARMTARNALRLLQDQGLITSEAGATLREQMDRMGHSTARAALIYQHATDERQRTIADAVGTMARAAMDEALKGKDRCVSGTDVARRGKEAR
jgi:GntR family transcriptional regulator